MCRLNKYHRYLNNFSLIIFSEKLKTHTENDEFLENVVSPPINVKPYFICSCLIELSN